MQTASSVARFATRLACNTTLPSRRAVTDRFEKQLSGHRAYRASSSLSASMSSTAAPELEDQEQRPKQNGRGKNTKRPARRVKEAADVDAAENGQPVSLAPEEAEGNADAPAPKKKRAKGSGLPDQPTGIRYEESMRPEKLRTGQTFMSWNVAGLRALVKKDSGALQRLLDQENVAVLCMQEIKLQQKHVEETTESLGLAEQFTLHCNCSIDKAGYSGVAMLVRNGAFDPEPAVTHGMGLPEHDGEGRVITLELPDLFLVNVYVPNSGDGLKRLDYRIGKWDQELSKYMGWLREKKPVVATGDFNCAREPIDIHNAKRNLKSAGFTPEERESFQKVYIQDGWVDTFRRQVGEGVHGYTYYGYRMGMRAKQKGWRLDYFLVSEGLISRLHDSFILPDFLGSDHCPLGLTLRLP